MAGLAAISKSLIVFLIGEQWLPSVELLQLLCLVGVMQPLNSMNINILNVIGRSDLYLKLQLISNAFIIPNIFIGIFFGIKALIIGTLVINIFNYLLFNHESNKYIHYSLKEQLRDILPGLSLALIMGITTISIRFLITVNDLNTLIIQVFTGILVVFIIGEAAKLPEYIILKNTFISKLKQRKLK